MNKLNMPRGIKADRRTGVFPRPANAKQVFEGRNVEDAIIVDRFSDIVSANEERGEGQVVVIDFDIIPPGEYENVVNFAKRGPQVMLPIPRTEDELISTKTSGVRARISASQVYRRRANERFAGISWIDPENYLHALKLWTVIEGHRMHQASKAARDIRDKIEIPGWAGGKYSAGDSYLKTVVGKVPSRSGDRKYTVDLKNIVRDPKDPRAFAEWARFRGGDDPESPFRRWAEVTFGNVPRGVRGPLCYSPHIWALYTTLSERIAQETGEIIMQPGPLFTEPMLRLYLGMTQDTLMRGHTLSRDCTENVRAHSSLRTPHYAEVEPVLINAWLTRGNKATLFAHSPKKGHKRMSEYNWDSHGPGMKFG